VPGLEAAEEQRALLLECLSAEGISGPKAGGSVSAPTPFPRLAALESYLKTIRWSHDDLARSLGVSRVYVGLVLAGKRRPSPRFVRDAALVLAPLLGVDPSDLRRVLFNTEVHEAEASVLEARLARAGGTP
jgi:transcriptional regulator with XRE-family HTH domain